MILSFHNTRRKGKAGYVYLLQCLSAGTRWKKFIGKYKIGFTTQKINVRKGAIEIAIQGKVQIIDCFWSEDPAREEIETHFALQNFRVKGEWFDIPEYMLKDDRRHLWFSSDGKGFLEVESIDGESLPVYSPGDFS